MESSTPITAGLRAVKAPEERLFLHGPAGKIEARLSAPAENAHRPAFAVVCHPHPLHGGSLDNKVTATLARTLNALGVPALRFNFRGVGLSDGHYDAGHGETEDLCAVIHRLQMIYPERELWLAGFSFGAYVALRAAQHVPAARLITVAPPVNLFDCAALPSPDCHWLLIHGADDELVPIKDVVKWTSRLYPAPDSVYLEDVGHYFHGKLNLLQNALMNNLPLPARGTEVA